MNSIKTNLKTPQILKQYPQHYFPPCETSKMTRRKLNISNFQNTKIENFQNSHEKGAYPRFLVCENLAPKNWRPPKWQEENWKLRNFKISKQKTFEVSKRKENTLFPPLWNFTQKFEDAQDDKKKIKDSKTSKYKNKKLSKVHKKKGKYPLAPLVKFHTNVFEDTQNDKKKNWKLWNFKIIKQKIHKIHKSKGTPAGPPPTSHQKNKLMTPKMSDHQIFFL